MSRSARTVTRRRIIGDKVGGTMNLVEAPICAKAVARLRSKGWRVGCEIRTDNRPIDAAAILNGKVLALEAKVSLNKKLRHQLKRLTVRADYVLGVVSSQPRNEGISWCDKHKIGLWIVTDGPIIELVSYRQLRIATRESFGIMLLRGIEGTDQTGNSITVRSGAV